MRALPVALLLPLALTPLLTADDWRQFRGPGGQGSSAEKKSFPVKWGPREGIAWKTELPGPGSSSPILVGPRIYLTCWTGYNVPGRPPGDMNQLRRHLVCLDRKTGKVLWNKDIPAKLPEQATIRDGHGYASSTLASDGERLYAFFGKSGVFAFDQDGRQLWQADVGSRLNGWGSGASLIVHNDLVIVNASVESESLIALNRKSGKEVWRVGGIKESWSTPVLVPLPGGKVELVVPIFRKVLGLDPGTGDRLWSCDTDIPWYMVPSLVTQGDVVYCIGGRSGGGGLAIRAGGRGDVTTSQRVWRIPQGSNVSSPVLQGGYLFWVHESNGIAYCIDAGTGKAVWEQRLPRAGQAYASAVLAGGQVYQVTRDGRVFVLAARPKYELLAVNEMRDGSMFNASPAASDGRLYIRSDRYLYCVGAE